MMMLVTSPKSLLAVLRLSSDPLIISGTVAVYRSSITSKNAAAQLGVSKAIHQRVTSDAQALLAAQASGAPTVPPEAEGTVARQVPVNPSLSCASVGASDTVMSALSIVFDLVILQSAPTNTAADQSSPVPRQLLALLVSDTVIPRRIWQEHDDVRMALMQGCIAWIRARGYFQHDHHAGLEPLRDLLLRLLTLSEADIDSRDPGAGQLKPNWNIGAIFAVQTVTELCLALRHASSVRVPHAELRLRFAEWGLGDRLLAFFAHLVASPDPNGTARIVAMID